MDYVAGGEIYQKMKKIKRLKEKDAAYIIKQLSAALA